MWHVRDEIALAILLVVDFGGWYRLDSKASNGNSSNMIQHTQVSLLKDIIVPYTHLLPRLHLSENQDRRTLLYFKGAKHRHRVSNQLPNLTNCCLLITKIFLDPIFTFIRILKLKIAYFVFHGLAERFVSIKATYLISVSVLLPVIY